MRLLVRFSIYEVAMTNLLRGNYLMDSISMLDELLPAKAQLESLKFETKAEKNSIDKRRRTIDIQIQSALKSILAYGEECIACQTGVPLTLLHKSKLN